METAAGGPYISQFVLSVRGVVLYSRSPWFGFQLTRVSGNGVSLSRSFTGRNGSLPGREHL